MEMIDTAEKKVLVNIVKLVQQRGMKGTLGDWKTFLSYHDKQLGASLSDPARRSHETLAAFLKTFSEENELKFFYTIIRRRHSSQDLLELLQDKSYDSPGQRLVQKTLQHRLYPLNYTFAELDEDWMGINLGKKDRLLRFTDMVAVDCEMVLCEDGTEAVVKVCVVDHNLKVKLNKLVHPNKAIADYRTEITGISPQDLEGVTCSLVDIHKSLRKLLSNGPILVGHSLYHDLHVLKVDYVKVIDTSYIYRYSGVSIRRRPSLNALCKAVLGYEVRKMDAPHNCLDDAMAAMKLVLAKIERGDDNAIPFVLEPVLESEMSKLLLHNISTSVDSGVLYKVVPGDFTLDLKPPKGGKYSAVAIFKNQQEADEAFEKIQCSHQKDSFGRLQKLVVVQHSTGMNSSVVVRKMAPDGPNDHIPSKRALEVDETSVSKKAKMAPEREGNVRTVSNVCGTHLNEIESLNQRLQQNDLEIESLRQQLKQKDYEISLLNKMVASLKTKLGK